MAKKFKTREELEEFKKSLASKFESGIPQYLQDFIDKKERRFDDEEYYTEKARRKYSFTPEERREFIEDKKQEFWENNKFRIFKSPKKGIPVYEESPKGEERVEEEKELSQEEINALISISESDLELFAMRYFPHYLKKPSSKFHKFLYGFLSRSLGNMSKRRRGFKKAIAAPRSNAKCLKRGTLIQLANGSLKKIEDLDPEDKVVSLGQDFKLCTDKVSLISKPEIRKVVDIRLKSGRFLSLTKDHRLFGIDGCKPLSEFSLGERVATPRKIDCDIVTNKAKTVIDIGKNQFLKDLANSDIYWDELVSISEEYEAETYDIQTETTGNFIANNIFSHNSSIMSGIFPLWCVCYQKKKFIIIISNSANQAEEFLEDIKRELEHNEILKRDFPHVVGKGPIWKRGHIITRNNVQIIALGSGSRIRGRKFGKDRPDLIALDDCEDDEMVRSKATRDFIRYEWFNKGVLHVGEADSSSVDFLFIGTINGKDCLLNALLDPDQYPDWSSNRFQAIEEFPTNMNLWDEWEKIYKNGLNKNREEDAWKFYLEHREAMEEGAKVLWPEGDPLYGLMVSYISDPRGFNSEKQNLPLDPSSLLFPIESLTLKDFSSPDIQEILNSKSTEFFSALDPSLGKNNNSDYSCLTTIARHKPTGLILVVDFDIKRRSVDEQVEVVLNKYEQFCKKGWGQKLIVCEENLFQVVLKDNIIKESRKRGLYAPIEGIANYKDKHARIESIAPLLRNGTVIFDSYKYKYNQQYALAVNLIAEYSEGVSHDDSCVIPNTLIITEDGVKPIKDINIGDRVLTHKGNFKRVSRVYKREVNEDLLKVNSVGNLDLIVTKNHPIFINEYYRKNIKNKEKQKFITTILNRETGDFVLSENLDKSKHMLTTPILTKREKVVLDMLEYAPSYIEVGDRIIGSVYSKNACKRANPRSVSIPRFIEVDEELAFILGYYLAEGNISSTHQFSFAGHVKERNVVDFLNKYFIDLGLTEGIYKEPKGKSRRITFSSKPFHNLFKTFNKSVNKKLPEFCMRLSDKETKALILGYMFGDGSFKHNLRSNSVSPNVSFQIFQLLLKIGIKTKIKLRRRKGRWKSFKGKMLENNTYNVECDSNEAKKLLKGIPDFIQNIYKNKDVNLHNASVIRSSIKFPNTSFVSKMIRKIETVPYKGLVYNLEVEDDNSYVANGISVHNCDALEICIRICKKKKFRMLVK